MWMTLKPPGVVIVIMFDGGLLEASVHSLHLPIGPGMLDLAQSVLNGGLLANTVEVMS
jgi:hypothetical protein